MAEQSKWASMGLQEFVRPSPLWSGSYWMIEFNIDWLLWTWWNEAWLVKFYAHWLCQSSSKIIILISHASFLSHMIVRLSTARFFLFQMMQRWPECSLTGNGRYCQCIFWMLSLWVVSATRWTMLANKWNWIWSMHFMSNGSSSYLLQMHAAFFLKLSNACQSAHRTHDGGHNGSSFIKFGTNLVRYSLCLPGAKKRKCSSR